MGVVDLLRLPSIVSRVGQDRDGTIAGSTDQDQTKVMRSPLYRVDTTVMVGILVYLGPLTPSFLPDNYSPVVRTRGKNVAKPANYSGLIKIDGNYSFLHYLGCAQATCHTGPS